MNERVIYNGKTPAAIKNFKLRRWFISFVCFSFLLVSLDFLFQWAGLDSGLCRKLAPVLGAHAMKTVVVQFFGGSALLGTLVGFAGKTIFCFLAGEADLSKAMLPGESSSGTRLALPSSSSSWTEDSFEMRVLLEPFSDTEVEETSNNPKRDEAGPSHQTVFSRNISLEASLQNRIRKLENDNCLFLLDKEKGAYWSEIHKTLSQAPSLREYNSLIELENKDLEIRELKHACFLIFQKVLSQQPTLAEKAAYNPQEALIDFFNEKRDELDTNRKLSLPERDQSELLFLEGVRQDIREHGPSSIYMGQILGYAANE